MPAIVHQPAVGAGWCGWCSPADTDLGRVSKFGKALSKRADAVIAGFQLVHRHSTIRGYALRVPRRGR